MCWCAVKKPLTHSLSFDLSTFNYVQVLQVRTVTRAVCAAAQGHESVGDSGDTAPYLAATQRRRPGEQSAN